MSGKRKNFYGKRKRFQRKYPEVTCSVCGKHISNVTTALFQPDDDSPAHFDCVLKLVKEKIKPVEGEKLIYLGHNSFAVVDYRLYKQQKLKIIRKTEWEAQEKALKWKKSIRIKLP